MGRVRGPGRDHDDGRAAEAARQRRRQRERWPRADESEADKPERGEEEERGGSGILGRTVGAILGVGTAREADEAGEDAEEPGDRIAAGEPAKEASVGENSDEAKEEPADEPETALAADAGDRIDLNRASFEQLRESAFRSRRPRG